MKHYGELRRRENGVAERGDPKPYLIEFRSPAALRDRFFDLVPEGERSDVMRLALEMYLDAIAGLVAAQNGDGP